MSKAIVGRPVDGITLNGELEFLLDDNGEVKVFDSPEQQPVVQEPFGWLRLPVFHL